jgi:hypothetical protein
MTESEAIAACRKLARRNWRERSRSYEAAFVPAEESWREVRDAGAGWLVVSRMTCSRGGAYSEDRFWVDDATGRVTWIQGEPSWWFRWAMYPIAAFATIFVLIALAIGAMIEGIRGAWRWLQLPRCPVCRAKLRTPAAKQCVHCGNAWHHGPPAPVQSAG